VMVDAKSRSQPSTPPVLKGPRKRPPPLVTNGSPKRTPPGLGTPVGESGWPVGLSPMPLTSPVPTWEEASAAGRASVQEALAAFEKLQRWPLQVPVVCGDKRGVLVGSSIVRCLCSLCQDIAPGEDGGCLFPAARFEKHSSRRSTRNWTASVTLDPEGEAVGKWLKSEAQRLEAEGVAGRRIRMYDPQDMQFVSATIKCYDGLHHHTVEYQDGTTENVMLVMEWLEWEDKWDPSSKQRLNWQEVDQDGCETQGPTKRVRTASARAAAAAVGSPGKRLPPLLVGTPDTMALGSPGEVDTPGEYYSDGDPDSARPSDGGKTLPRSMGGKSLPGGKRLPGAPSGLTSPLSPLGPDDDDDDDAFQQRCTAADDNQRQCGMQAEPRQSLCSKHLALERAKVVATRPPGGKGLPSAKTQPAEVEGDVECEEEEGVEEAEAEVAEVRQEEAEAGGDVQMAAETPETEMGEVKARPEADRSTAAQEWDEEGEGEGVEMPGLEVVGKKMSTPPLEANPDASKADMGELTFPVRVEPMGASQQAKPESKLESKTESKPEMSPAETKPEVSPAETKPVVDTESKPEADHPSGMEEAGTPRGVELNLGPRLAEVPQTQAEKDEAVKRLWDAILKNKEPSWPGDWQRTPWDVQRYERITEYIIPDDPGLVGEKGTMERMLRTRKKGGCDGLHCQDKHTLGFYDAEKDAFSTACTCLKANTECDANCACSATSCANRNVSQQKGLKLGEDVAEQSLWGIDCYTHQNIRLALALVEGMEADKACIDFIEQQIMRTVQRVGKRGWDVYAVLDAVKASAESTGDDLVVRVARILRWLVEEVELLGAQKKEGKGARAEAPGNAEAPAATSESAGEAGEEGSGAAVQRLYFRIYPKGVGVLCTNPEGVAAEQYVVEYLGELYPPWRWFEKQDAIKKCNPNLVLPAFYNICFERPRDDDQGYAVGYVEAAARGSYGSRLSHSCDPNCQSVMMACDGRLTIAMRTTRPVALGEELTWDYACVTESEKEFRTAICLCGAAKCRGSFLYYANGNSFTMVSSKKHTFTDRNALLLRAGGEKINDDDRALLERHGLRAGALSGLNGKPLVDWMVKWAALILRFIEGEQAELPGLLLKESVPGRPDIALHNDESAKGEAKGVSDSRLQNLVITLNKLAYVFSEDGQPSNAPLQSMDEDAVVRYLVTGDDSIAVRLLGGVTGGRKTNRGESVSANPHVQEMQRLVKLPVTTLKEAQQVLLQMAGHLRRKDGPGSAAADLAVLYGSTDHWCVAEKKYLSVTSVGVPLRPEEMGPNSPDDGTGGEKLIKKYKPSFIWGQLVAWYKQTIYDPSASLSADRRGTLSLPDPESAFGGKYPNAQRKHLLEMLERAPSTMWPTGTIWSFKNKAKVYGSPMLDDAVLRSKGEPGKMSQVLDELKNGSEFRIQEEK
ncbi:hypothetical protein CYMTET_14822, partial [Cymbomonas tetramitiformis]